VSVNVKAGRALGTLAVAAAVLAGCSSTPRPAAIQVSPTGTATAQDPGAPQVGTAVTPGAGVVSPGATASPGLHASPGTHPTNTPTPSKTSGAVASSPDSSGAIYYSSEPGNNPSTFVVPASPGTGPQTVPASIGPGSGPGSSPAPKPSPCATQMNADGPYCNLGITGGHLDSVDAQGNATGPKTTFSAATDKTILVVLDLSGLGPGTVITYVQILGTTEIKSQDVTLQSSPANLFIKFTAGPSGSLAQGQYRMRFYVNPSQNPTPAYYLDYTVNP
jgi:hypothetical protein